MQTPAGARQLGQLPTKGSAVGVATGSAVATGSVLLGDKQEAEKYKQYNADHVPDLIRPGASAWSTDWLGESKVPSSLTAAASPPPACHYGPAAHSGYSCGAEA